MWGALAEALSGEPRRMDSRVKFLDELILAIRSSSSPEPTGSQGPTHNDSFPLAAPHAGDPKATKVLKTLVKNLHEARSPPDIFYKSIEALDMLIQMKPYILHIPVAGVSDEVGIIWLLSKLHDISCIHWERNSYLWVIRRKLFQWCQLISDTDGLNWSVTISSHLFSQLTRKEEALRSYLSGNGDSHMFVELAKSIHVLCQWGCCKEIKSVLASFDTDLDSNKWEWFFERLLRIVFYVFDSVILDTAAFDELLSKFIVLVADYVINGRHQFHRMERRLTSDTHLKFCLGILYKYLPYISDWDKMQDTTVAKSLLRIYLLVIRDSFLYQTFDDNFPLIQWYNTECDTNQPFKFGKFTNRALSIILFDMQRRSADPQLLSNEDGVMCLKSEEYVMLQSQVSLAFTQSRQLENLRKCILESFNSPKETVLDKDFTLFGLQAENRDLATYFGELERSIIHSFQSGNQHKLVYATRLLGKMACLESSSMATLHKESFCEQCDHLSPGNPFVGINPARPEAKLKSTAFQILVRYFLNCDTLIEFSESLLSGILLALIRIFTHFQPPPLSVKEQQIYDHTAAFQFFHNSFVNPNRYLRILSTKLLPLWNFSAKHNFEDQHTAVLIHFLQSNVSQSIIETSLMAWVQLTLTTSGESFDSLLLKLVDIFNSTNFVERSMMGPQLRYIASLTKKTPYQLLSPILPIMLKQIGKNLVERKLSFERLVEFVEYPSKTILENFQRYIIPYAISQYKNDVITEVANIMCDYDASALSKQKERLLDRNSRQIFAVALVKHGFFSLDTLETLFLNCVPTFDKSYVIGYLPDYRTLAEVLKLYNNVEDSNKSVADNENMVLCSLRFLVTNFEREKRHGSRYKSISEWTADQESAFQSKLQDNILGIFQVFSSDMHDIEGKTTYYEKLRVINGIHFLLKYSSSECIISALAQISICLQTGQEITEIQLNTFKCWLFLIKRLNEEQLSTVIDSLVPFALQKWETFNLKVKLAITDIITTLMDEKKNLILNSKPHITWALLNKPEINILEKNKSFARMINKVLLRTNWCREYADILRSNNKYVILQSLHDVRYFLKRRQAERMLQQDAKEEPDSDLPVLLGSLLDAAYRFRVSDIGISQKCASCISIIGVLDVTKYQLIRKSTHMDDVYDFNDKNQTIKFLINIINKILVPAFWESENPTKQLFVALVMQESLKYCGLSSSSWDVHKPNLYPDEAKLWDRFDDTSKTTLYPLLSSLYLAQSWKEYVPIKYPSFNVKESYRAWVKNLTLDLLKTATSEEHPLHVFSSLIREDDGFLSENLLPYIVMDIVINAEKGTAAADLLQNIKVEFEYIFEYELRSLNHFQIDSLKMCYDTIFKVFEYCKKWITQFKQEYNRRNGTFTIREKKYLNMLERADLFLKIIPFGVMAQRSLETDSFERSALYLEQSYRLKDEKYFGNDKLLPYLQTTYAEIGDIDSVEGVLKVFSAGSIASKIEELQYSDNWLMAQQCYEALGDSTGSSARYEQLCGSATTKMLKSMYQHQLYDQTLVKLSTLAPTNVRTLKAPQDEWYSMGLECAYLSGNHEVLTEWTRKVEALEFVEDPSVLLHYNFAKALLSVSHNDSRKMKEFVDKCFKLIGTHFTAPSAGTTLLKRRDILLKLHALRDVLTISKSTSSYQFIDGLTILDSRLQKVGQDFEPNHFLLSVRKSYDLLLHDEPAQSDLANTFFKIAQISRVNSRVDLANSSLMRALKYDYPSAELEYAEILWKQGENDKALKLVAEINEKFKQNPSLQPREKAKVLLKYTEWLDMSNNSVSEQIIKQYNDIIRLDPKWDEPYYSFGLYFSKLLEKKNAEGHITTGRLEFRSVSYFLLAFEKNTSKIREALPKVVTFWLDIAALSITENSAGRREVLKRSTDDICKRIESAVKNCPTFIWYSVQTQLLSRLLHVHKVSAQLIMHILLNLAIEYPAHVLWYISVLLNSNFSERVTHGSQIMERFKQHSLNSENLVASSQDLVKALTFVCTKDVKSSSSRAGRSLEKDFSFNMSFAPSGMAVPINANMEMLSPSSAESVKKYQPFRPVITIAKFGSSYKVFSSLKKPKKLNVVGSDGKIYGIMCKKEDVRQDNQYMQFATTMDFLLKKDLASRKRDLGIITYCVLSLREDCGLLEMVPEVTTLRSILVTKYDSMKIKYSLKSLHERWQSLPDDQKLGFFQDLTSKFPPVLYQWFLEIFPDPTAWYNGRNMFARSYAVMAMVGHILGLGDRHCENILLDVRTGKVLHVDFDCLFEKGKKLPIPEIVPFRLTQNLSDALGITGTEGTFKKSSEVTLALMRNNEVALVNIIETIMYDRNMDHSIQKALKVLRNKVRGIDPRDGLVLSVPGQVETVTQEAASKENLSKMYVGWLPFW